MQLEIVSAKVQERRFVLSRHVLLVALLFIVALSVRIYRIHEPPLNFHATRQYRSLLIARGYYYERSPEIPEWKKQVAGINVERQGMLEPPVMELLVAAGYRLAGGEHFWISRFMATLFWLVGGGFLYRIAARLAGARAALFSAAFYLFLPFAVVASRSFQPDPLMMMLLLAGILAMLRYHEEPSRLRLVVAAVFSATAVFVKPVSLFVICTVFMVLAIRREGLKRVVVNRATLVFLVVIFLPALLFYIFYGMFFLGDLRLQAQASFLPQLLLDPFFWRGWFNYVQQVIGLPALVVAFLGVLMFQKGVARSVIIGLWIGYVLFCLVFHYHIASHDYYHLQLVPIVALSLGPVAALIVDHLQKVNQEWYRRLALWAVLLLALLLSLNASRSLLLTPGFERQVRTAETIGRLVDRSPNTIFLASDYGTSLQYHGELAGRPWPLVSDLEWERLAGAPIPDAQARFNDWFAPESPNYFIVLDLWEFEEQEDLRRFLFENFAIVTQGDDYVIFDLQPG